MTAPPPKTAPPPVNRPLLPSAAQIAPYLERIDASRWYTNRGPLLVELEQRLCALAGLPEQALTLTASGTAALEAAILATAGPASAARPHALIPSYTFPATALAAERCGYRPWFVDVDPATMAVDPRALARHPQLARCGVILPVAAYGMRPDLAAYERLRAETGIAVVVDAAAAFEQVLAHRLISEQVPLALSFHATKSFSTGEGGAVLWGAAEGYAEISRIINFGFLEGRETRSPGLNGKLSDYHAAVGLAMLDIWPERQAAQAGVAALYRRSAADCGLDGALLLTPEVSSAYALLRCRDASQAAGVTERLTRRGMDWRRWYEGGVHRMRHFAALPRDALPGTEELAATLIGLPTAIDLSRDALDPVLRAAAG
ncbi:DegT/DnrJ/EryC1/StrS family aminotransferase [Shimia sp.]|uniref:DegT/DnrJ/EryC1/StrS family aminotransferase n=1 Tax=Shimia sp. TaxID=1954381 RepID=UPI0035627616